VQLAIAVKENYHQLENGWKNGVNDWKLSGNCKLHFINISKVIKISISTKNNNCRKMKSNECKVHNIIINNVLFMNFQNRVKTWIGIIVMLVVYNLRKKQFLQTLSLACASIKTRGL